MRPYQLQLTYSMKITLSYYPILTLFTRIAHNYILNIIVYNIFTLTFKGFSLFWSPELHLSDKKYSKNIVYNNQ